MNEWRECKLGDTIELLYGKGLREVDRKKGNIPVYGSNGIVGYHNEYLVKGPGIVIGRKGSVGEIKYSVHDFYPIDTTYYVKKNDEHDLKFLYYFLLTLKLNEMNSHSAVPGLNRNDVHSLDVTIPPLPEQRAIASVLSSLDDKIDLLHRQNTTLEKLAETLFRQWFVEEAEEDWEAGTLSDIMVLSNGKSRPTGHGNIPIYGGNGILGYANHFNYSDQSIIIGRVGAYCGSLFFETGNIWVSDNALHAIAKNENENFYLFYLLRYLNLNSFAEGSSHPLLTQTLLNSIQTSIPCMEIRHGFNKIAESFYKKIGYNKKQIANLEKLRGSLLPKLISGEARVKTSEHD